MTKEEVIRWLSSVLWEIFTESDKAVKSDRMAIQALEEAIRTDKAFSNLYREVTDTLNCYDKDPSGCGNEEMLYKMLLDVQSCMEKTLKIA